MTFVTPTLLAGDGSLANVIIHEITHSWTGNLVTNRTWEDFWLNEGCTMFVQRKIMGEEGLAAQHSAACRSWFGRYRYAHGEPLAAAADCVNFAEKLDGFQVAEMDMIGGVKGLSDTINKFGPSNPLTELCPKLDGVDPDDAFSRVPYEKGTVQLACGWRLSARAPCVVALCLTPRGTALRSCAVQASTFCTTCSPWHPAWPSLRRSSSPTLSALLSSQSPLR